jgi:CPA2 family monovalent cation:H+ antiporter-2/glutathione-regulated potassium-efflux system protein KefB
MGMLLSQGGEFGFVLFAEAERGLLISHPAAQLFGAVVTISMALTPLVFIVGSRLRAPTAAINHAGPESAAHFDGDEGRVVIVGVGRFGQVVTQMLRGRGIEITAIDLDAELIDISKRFGNTVYYGDGRRIDVLKAAGIERAGLLVFAIDGAWDPEATLAPIRAQWPNLKILARAYDRQHWLKLRHAGVETIVRETFDSGITMGRFALAAFGTPETIIDAIEDEYRRRDTERLNLQLTTDDITAGADRMIRGRLSFDPAALGEIPFDEAAE